MLTDVQVKEFLENGFINAGPVIDAARVQDLREELDRVIADDGKADVRQPQMLRNLSSDDTKPVIQIVNIWEASPAFRRLLGEPKIVEEIAQLTGASELRIWHDQIQYKPAGYGGINGWHQDAPLWPVLAPMTEVSAWVALDDVDESNGCMSMVVGSHRWGNQIAFLHSLESFDLPSTHERRAVEVRLCPVKAGEVHYHHALTWHGSHANTSERPRRAIAMHYMTQDTRYVASGSHPIDHLITVGDGEPIGGPNFPQVYPAA